MRQHGATPDAAKAIATSAFRNAKNGKELAQKIYNTTGIEVNIISGDQEAELIYYGVKAALNVGHKPELIMDVGGGSVEFIICTGDELLWKQSFEVGAQRLFELFHRADPIAPEMIAEMHDYLRQQLLALHEACQKYKPRTLIGSSGAFDTFCEIEYLRSGKSLNLFKNTELPLTPGGFYTVHSELKLKNVSERRAVPGMSEMRVDMIVVAGELISHVMQTCDISKMRVSAFSLKEGALFQLFQNMRSAV